VQHRTAVSQRWCKGRYTGSRGAAPDVVPIARINSSVAAGPDIYMVTVTGRKDISLSLGIYEENILRYSHLDI